MIKILKLSNGEEVVGELVDNHQTKIVLKEPMNIVYRYHPASPFPHVKLTRYMLFSSDILYEFSNMDVYNVTQARESFANYYLHVRKMTEQSGEMLDRELNEAVQADQVSKEEVYRSMLDQIQKPDIMN